MAHKRREPAQEFAGNRLQRELQEELDRLGPEHYARATAKKFARGGQYHPGTKRRPRYALT